MSGSGSPTQTHHGACPGGIILASASPRRKELLGLAGFAFDVAPAAGKEETDASLPGDIVEQLARHKAREVFLRNRSALVIGADTIVYCEGKVLGKPRSKDEAREMIRMLSGTSHQVYTGVCFVRADAQGQERLHCFHEKTDVEICPMTQEEIEEYISTDEPYDKAGGYGIQGRFARYVSGIRGDYYNVMGLPVSRLYHEMSAFSGEYRPA